MHPSLRRVEAVRRRGTGLLGGCLGILLLACTDNTAPVVRTAMPSVTTSIARLDLLTSSTAPSQLMKVETGVPDQERYEASFWAVQGQQTDFEVRYATDAGTGSDFSNFLRLKIPAQAELVDATGKRYLPGSSVQIYIHIVREGDKVEATFGPEGLSFEGTPAEVVTYAATTSTSTSTSRVSSVRKFSNYAVAF